MARWREFLYNQAPLTMRERLEVLPEELSEIGEMDIIAWAKESVQGADNITTNDNSTVNNDWAE